jgi:16S rRNA G966 N2-methylase RsmD
VQWPGRDVLREQIKAESADLIYLDPPFNSKRDTICFSNRPRVRKATRLGVAAAG